jgi:hypothetical protein
MARRRHVRLLRAERNSLADFTRHGERAGDLPRRTGSAGRRTGAQARLALRDGRQWCGRGDSNPHALRRQNLNLVRLPIPPLPHGANSTATSTATGARLHGTSPGDDAAAKRKSAETAAATATSRPARQHATPHSRNRHEHQNRPAGCLPCACRGRLRSTRNRRPFQHPTARRCRQHRTGLHHVGQRPAARLSRSGRGSASTAGDTRRGTTSRAVTGKHRCGRSPCESQTPGIAPGGPPYLLEGSLPRKAIRRCGSARARIVAVFQPNLLTPEARKLNRTIRRGTMPIQRMSARSAARTKKRTPGIAPGRSVLGGPSRIRTLDLLIKSQLLYQLS